MTNATEKTNETSAALDGAAYTIDMGRRDNRANGEGTLEWRKTGKRGGVWLARWTVGGKRHTKSTKTADRKEAERILADYVRPYQERDKAETYALLSAKSAYHAGLASQAEIPPVKLTHAVDAVFQRGYARDIEEASKAKYYRVMEALAKWGEVRNVTLVSGIDKDLATTYAANLRTQLNDGEITANVFNTHINSLKWIWDKLSDMGAVKINPWKAFQSEVAAHRSHDVWTDDEVERILVAARAEGAEYEAAITIAALCGFRVSDAVSVKWEHIDREQGVIQFVPKKTRKYGTMVRRAIHPTLKHILDTMWFSAGQPKSGYVTPALRERYAKNTLRCAFLRIYKAAGVDTKGREGTCGKTFHSFRHFFASRLYNNGLSLDQVADACGHTSAKMAARYAHMDERMFDRAVLGETTRKETHSGHVLSEGLISMIHSVIGEGANVEAWIMEKLADEMRKDKAVA